MPNIRESMNPPGTMGGVWNSPAAERYPFPPRTRFLLEVDDGQRLSIYALGVALDGEHMLFFKRWPETTPTGDRVPRDRIRSITLEEKEKPSTA